MKTSGHVSRKSFQRCQQVLVTTKSELSAKWYHSASNRPIAGHIQNMTPKTPKAPKVPPKKALAPDPGNYDFLGSRLLDYTIPAWQAQETSVLNLRLILMAKTVSLPKQKRVSARTLAASKKIGIATVSAFSGLGDHAGLPELRYARASSTVPG